MIRVAYVIWSLGLGGAEQVVIRLASSLDRRRFRPVIFCLNEAGVFAPQATQAGIDVVALEKRGPVDLGAVFRLAGLLRTYHIQVLHTHLWGANLWGRLAARLAGVPTVITTEHNVDTWKRWYHFAIDRVLVGGTTQLVAVSQQVRQFYESRGVGRGRWQVIYNGVDTSAASVRRRSGAYDTLGIKPGDRVVGLIGRLVPAKAPQVFLDAVAQAAQQVPTLKALIIGDGPLRQDVEAQVRRLGLAERVLLTGTRTDIRELLAGMDAVVFSSEREGLSMAMLEAMAAGVPVVATRVGGTPELIESGVNGLLVSPSSPQELAEGLAALLRDPERSTAISRAARKRIEERFALSAMVQAHEALYAGAGARPVRVVHVIDHLGSGGAQRQLVELVRRLPRDRWDPVVISLSTERTGLVEELTQAGICVHLVPQHGTVDLACLWALTRLLGVLRPAIVHTWLFTADTYGRIGARLAGVRHTICAIRNTIDDFPERYRVVNRWLTRWTDYVTVNAEAIRANLTEAAGVPARKIRTIYNGIDLSEFPPAHANGLDPTSWPVPPSGKIVAMVARLAPQKDHRTFLEATARIAPAVPDAHFVLIGDGAMRTDIERRIQELRLGGRVHLLGERGDVKRLLAHIAVCVLATHYEGCSNVIMEAMAAGRPVVATDVGGNAELVVHGQTGLLVPDRDVRALADAMVALLTDPERAQAMGREGRHRIEQRFSLERMVQETTTLYAQVLTPSAAGTGRLP